MSALSVHTARELRTLLARASGLLTALVGDGRTAAIGKGLARIREVTPRVPHAYLHFLAVDPGLQRRGLGRKVIVPGLRRAERAGLGVHLETTNTENLAFYQRLGFEVSESLRLSEGGPTLWAMWRAPRITGE
ncbi:GNAT family N-acetyltransferase [Phytoactinopolyspora mesophila]|uniref:GNAT family N-acetyltransferase n=1 Tax=Phytoactinopolyspora mesophila TaxID=2650750 RepID=A0A7K3M7L4_9ACTN|nr:GNAT family N-acetyltransferase [Phytoactinopolyspora mesophila]NDL59311.1 GNAT family N-acetyltransferase [Phytoactinopolyspora mesophila]